MTLVLMKEETNDGTVQIISEDSESVRHPGIEPETETLETMILTFMYQDLVQIEQTRTIIEIGHNQEGGHEDRSSADFGT